MIRSRTTKEGKKSYQAIVRVKGYPDKVKTFSSKREAESWETKIKAAMQSGRYQDDAESQRRTLGNAVDRYLSEILSPATKNYKTILGHLRWWKQNYGKYSMVQITSDLICRAKDELAQYINPKGKKRTPATTNRYLASLSVLLSAACNEWGWLHESPMPRVRKLKEPRGRVRFLDAVEREKLLGVCHESESPHLYPIVVLALSTGMRRGEIVNLKWSDVNLVSGRAVIHETKNGERRVVPLTGYALDVLKKLATSSELKSLFVFPNRRKAGPVAITTSWNNAVQRAGIQNFRFHDLRHSAASYLAMNGATLAELAEVLGHKTLAMVKRYAHLSEAHTKGVVSRMNDAIFGQSA